MRKLLLTGAAGLMVMASMVLADDKPDFPPFKDVSKGYEKVVSTVDGRTFYTLWTKKKDGQMLAELPQGYGGQKHFFAMTVSSGTPFAGLQSGDMYVYWKRHDKRMMLMAPQLAIKSTGDRHSKASVKRLFTDRVVLDVPIVAMGPSGQPVIDFDALLLGQSGKFFGGAARGINARLATIAEAKSFPSNNEIAFDVPGAGGQMTTLHYSISLIKGTPGFKPRKADERIGYFTVAYNDLGDFQNDETWKRFITRWHLEKADPSLKLSPPKQPIVFYIEHTTPVRYRRWVREGILYWNKAFEQIGIKDAIEVYYQDETTGAHMDKDPEDVRYNFIRWLNNDIGTAIGPSRVNPTTGEILDADIIMTDGWIRAILYEYNRLMPELAMEGMSPQTMAWLADHPNWDPRVRLAPAGQRGRLLAQRAAAGVQPWGGHAAASIDPTLAGDDEYDGLTTHLAQFNGMCLNAQYKAMDIGLLRMQLATLRADDDDEGDEGEKEEPKGDVLDGIPDSFIGPIVADVICHEVGHTLGLRHNFKASAQYSMNEINSEQMKGTPFAGSVMDYLPVNFNMDENAVQGDYAMTSVGTYDMWAIEYGYTFDKDLKPILDRVAEPGLDYLTDEDTWGPDPYARRFDLGKDPLNYANEQIKLADYHRARLLDKFVEDGDSWSRARRGYEMTLGLQMRAVSMMSNWIGGSYVHRDKKGDTNGRAPTEVVETEKQRQALDFVIQHAFYDEAFGLSPELLKYLTIDKWWDDGGMSGIFEDPAWPVHDRIMGLQASALTMLLNPTTLQRVFDNELRIPTGEDALTLAEMMDTITGAVWSELDDMPRAKASAREPAISSLRRNLQHEHMERLLDLAFPGAGYNAAYKPIADLSAMHLADLHEKIGTVLKNGSSRLDPYTLAHLNDAHNRIGKALDAQYIYNANDIGGGGSMPFFFFQPTPEGTK
jgi:hypothetical protein